MELNNSVTNKYENEEGYPLVCRKCGHTVFKEVVRNSIDFGVGGGGLPCEIEYLCDKCGDSAAYWAYGTFEPWPKG